MNRGDGSEVSKTELCGGCVLAKEQEKEENLPTASRRLCHQRYLVQKSSVSWDGEGVPEPFLSRLSAQTQPLLMLNESQRPSDIS